MKTTVVVFPFDLFGSPGTGAGAHLLADELREVLADNRRETVPTRAQSYTPHVRLRETRFERLDDYTDWRRQGRQLVRSVLRQGDFLVWLGGNHLAALPVYDELSTRDSPAMVVQLDAHLDIHHFRDCTEELSHGNFLLHCAGPLPRIVNVGHRDLLLPRDHIARFYHAALPATRLASDWAGACSELRQLTAGGDPVYLDIDCDVFDPSYFSAVCQPVPFGLPPWSLLSLLDAVWSKRVAGIFLSEFAPARDRDDQSLAMLVWLLEYVLLRRYE